jgi:hypothetical protein
MSESGQNAGLSPLDEQYVLERAYIPEHLPGLMTMISKGLPLLVGDCITFSKDKWLILVGYPLQGQFSQASCELALRQARAVAQPEVLWFIGPEIPTSLLKICQERSSDSYYVLHLDGFEIRSSLRRAVEKASYVLNVEKEQEFDRDHQSLVGEFLRRHNLPPMVAELYRLMPEYLAQSSSACLLSARDERGRLNAFYVVEQAAPSFDVYVLGCYSRKNYVPYASDLLFYNMIELAIKQGKKEINLGLGVNKGIRRFKEKWGGVPDLRYEFCECRFGPAKALSILDSLLEANW